MQMSGRYLVRLKLSLCGCVALRPDLTLRATLDGKQAKLDGSLSENCEDQMLGHLSTLPDQSLTLDALLRTTTSTQWFANVSHVCPQNVSETTVNTVFTPPCLGCATLVIRLLHGNPQHFHISCSKYHLPPPSRIHSSFYA